MADQRDGQDEGQDEGRGAAPVREERWLDRRWVALPQVRRGLHVSASRRPDGALLIHGQDVQAERFTGIPGAEYEYGLTIAPVDVPAVVRALCGEDGDDVLDLLAVRGEPLVRRGESRWLSELGVAAEVWNRGG